MSLFNLSLCVCMCTCVESTCICACRGQKTNVGIVPQNGCLPCFETKASAFVWVGWADWPMSPRVCLSLPPQCWHNKCVSLHLFFFFSLLMWVLGGRTQVLVFIRQIFYWLSHLPSSLWMYVCASRAGLGELLPTLLGGCQRLWCLEFTRHL